VHLLDGHHGAGADHGAARRRGRRHRAQALDSFGGLDGHLDGAEAAVPHRLGEGHRPIDRHVAKDRHQGFAVQQRREVGHLTLGLTVRGMAR
jgi:hypothetical protein